MRPTLFVIVVSIALLCVGCEPIPTAKKADRVPFPQAEYERLAAREGTSVVTGQAFMRTIGGDVKTAAGSEVWLNPETDYSRQWFHLYYKQGFDLGEPDPRIRQYCRVTTADAEGRFTFRDVPAGSFYLSTVVQWYAPTRNGLRVQGGSVAKRIDVIEGENTDVILSR